MKPQEAECIEKMFETLPKLSDNAQARILGIAEGMSIALEMQEKKNEKPVEKAS